MPTPEAPHNEFKDHYSTLGLRGRDPSSITPQIIQRQYRLLARTIHPDKFYDPEDKLKASAKMASLNEAYQVLKDPLKKSDYDREYINWRNTHGIEAGKVGFLEQLDNLPEILRDLFKDLAKASKLNISFASFEKYNLKTLDELHAIEELAMSYPGELKRLYLPELLKFSETIRVKERGYRLSLWTFMTALKAQDFRGLNFFLVQDAKREWEIYREVFFTGEELETRMDNTFKIIEEEHNRNPWVNRGIIIGFNEMLGKMS